MFKFKKKTCDFDLHCLPMSHPYNYVALVTIKLCSNCSTNVQRRREGKPSQYWDDSGVWGASSSPPTPFIFQNGKWRSLRLKQGVYCVLKYKNKKEEYVPLDPQPNPEDVVKVHRLYHKLQVNKPDATKFQRRITWIEKSDSILQEILRFGSCGIHRNIPWQRFPRKCEGQRQKRPIYTH